MELRQLEYVVMLAEELHFGRAAGRLHVVQSALSQQVKRLERELGVPLFDRSTHHVRLTSAGSSFVAEARRVLSGVERARAAARADVDDELRVCVGEATIDTMPRILAEVRAHFPHLVISEVEGGLLEQRRGFAEGTLDLALAQLLNDPSMVGASLSTETIRIQDTGVYVASSSPIAAQDTVQLAELADQQFIFAPEQRVPEYNRFLLDLLEDAGVEPRRFRGSADRVAGAFQIVARDAAVLCGPKVALGDSGVVWRPLTPTVPFLTQLVYPSSGRAPLVDTVIGIARDVALSEGWLETDAG